MSNGACKWLSLRPCIAGQLQITSHAHLSKSSTNEPPSSAHEQSRTFGTEQEFISHVPPSEKYVAAPHLSHRPLFYHLQRRLFSTSSSFSYHRFDRKKSLQESMRSKDIGTIGELTMTQALELPALEQKLSEAAAAVASESGGEVVPVRRKALDWMPRPEDYDTVYENGKKFRELPIIFLKAGKNNTKIAMTDAREFGKAYTSAGIEGFKGCKRGTNIAAQTSAMSFAKRLVRQSKVTHVRVVVNGLGPGRLSAIEGLVMGGLNVVSITDNTKTFGLDPGQGPGPRPRKVRRV